MVRRCVIQGCESKSTLPEHQGVTFHSFPFDSKTRDIWIENCHLSPDKNITKNILVCSRHFRRGDFQPMKSGKYFLKNGACPSVFPWGKIDSSASSLDSTPVSRVNSEASENAKASTVEATIAQIMAETAELNRAASMTSKVPKKKASHSEDLSLSTPCNTFFKMGTPTTFTPGVRLEVQEIDGLWHSGRVVEVDNDDREVLIKFEKTGKTSRAESEEWIPMNSSRLRQKSSAKLISTFIAKEKCFARWTGSRKFPATVQKVLGDDLYEVLFEDGFIKTVRGAHMSKIKTSEKLSSPNAVGRPPKALKSKIIPSSDISLSSSEGVAKKSKSKKNRKDWPLISMDTLDLASLNLPKVPKDGEWTCHWVNDQPIGQEGFLLIGEHKKPTVIVDDWRLPHGWVKHMYQRSNVLGKWDVILVNPSGKRFRSKADLKQALEDAGQVYNPDIYDFSIHRRRAKDINAYVYTADYKPPPKSIFLSNSLQDSRVSNFSLSSCPETSVVASAPSVEIMTPQSPPKAKENNEKIKGSKEHNLKGFGSPKTEEVSSPVLQSLEDGYAYIGGLKVQIVDNLFRCPRDECCKNFRKENHLQIHIKHYHQDLIKHLGSCPNMQDLALKRTIGHPDSETHPRNQIPNQQFFAKMHQQDIQHSRSHRKSSNPIATVPTIVSPTHTANLDDNSSFLPGPVSTDVAMDISISKNNTKLESTFIGPEVSLVNKVNKVQKMEPPTLPSMNSTVLVTNFESIVKSRPAVPFEITKTNLSTIKSLNTTGARKSNRQRTTKKYLNGPHTSGSVLVQHSDGGICANDFEETRYSLNTTTDKPTPTKKLKFFPVVNGSTNRAAGIVTMSSFPDPSESPKYIKENGELIKIVRMKQEEIINCLCSYGEEDGLMIQCELCLCWQHGSCNGIDKESEVPDKYVCYICRNPQRGRESRKYIHDQDWLYEGKLPAANYHEENPMHPERFEILKKSHTLSGNLIELKRFLHSLQVKINIAENKDHPKMYLWEKRWDGTQKDVLKVESSKTENDVEMKDVNQVEKSVSNNRRNVKVEPHIPQPEAPIDPVECQHRLLEHIKVQQGLVINRLENIEAEVNELGGLDNLIDLKSGDLEKTNDILASFIKDLETMKVLSKINFQGNIRNSSHALTK